MNKPIHEVAIAIVRHDGAWLVARRNSAAHLGGLWEFPGGKLLAGETPADAARRELQEECDVTADVAHVLHTFGSEHSDRVVRITPVICRWRAGTPQPLGNDECRWVTTDELLRLPMPPINAAIIAAVRSEPSDFTA